ncbi:hypothetical protein MRB53_042367 [Persea americana]|nr:hypothetical protein MRB53_042367 [Persea americana]
MSLSFDSLLNDPMWGPLSVDVDPSLHDKIEAQSKLIDEQKALLKLRDSQIKRLKSKEATSGVQVLNYLQRLEEKFDITANKTRPVSAQFDDFSEMAQRRIAMLEKRLQLRDDAIQLINAMLVDTITSKDAEIDALSLELEIAKDVMESLKRPELENMHIVKTIDSESTSRSSMVSDF